MLFLNLLLQLDQIAFTHLRPLSLLLYCIVQIVHPLYIFNLPTFAKLIIARLLYPSLFL